MPLDNDVDLDALVSSTPGMAGADLASLATEAALLAARRNHNKGLPGGFDERLQRG
jgi:cell division protease FtsH